MIRQRLITLQIRKHAFSHGLTAAFAIHRGRREQLGCDAVFWHT